MQPRHGFGWIVAVLGLWIAMPQARAGFDVFTNEAAYNAATTGNSTPITFEGIAADNSFLYVGASGGAGLDVSNVSFTSDISTSNGVLYVIGKNTYYTGNSVFSSQYYNTSSDVNIVVTLPNAATAFGLNLGDFNGSSSPLTITLSSGEIFHTSTVVFPTMTFVGFASSTPFTSIKISDPNSAVPNGVLNIDNFRFGSRAVPTPSSLALLVIGGFGAFGKIRSRRRPQAA